MWGKWVVAVLQNRIKLRIRQYRVLKIIHQLNEPKLIADKDTASSLAKVKVDKKEHAVSEVP